MSQPTPSFIPPMPPGPAPVQLINPDEIPPRDPARTPTPFLLAPSSHPPTQPPPSVPNNSDLETTQKNAALPRKRALAAHRSSARMRETSMDHAGRPDWGNLDVFRHMSIDALERLREAMEPVSFQKGDMILRQGEDGDAMYLLDHGSVKVSVRGAMHDTNFERVLSPPALFGEMALVTRVPRTATVTAEDDVRCLRVSAHSFEELVRRNPQVGAFVTKAVGERLLEADSIQHVSKYQVIGRLGAGAVATVFEAVHPSLGRTVALKMLSHGLVFHPKFAQQFNQEAQLVAQLNHDHIVKVFDTEQAYGTHFIVMEKLSGLTLDDLIRASTRLAWGAVRRILREICSALAYSHGKGLLHRDIKPSNVFLTEEDRRVKLLDFGIAAAAGSASTESGHLLGTPYYMSPEQITGRPLDGRSDQYSLAILAYEFITHEVPFDAETIDELLNLHVTSPMPDPALLVPSIPEDLREFILRAGAKSPEDRFSSCDEAMRFLLVASELPVVHRIELSTLAISYHPSRRAMVEAAVTQLRAQLDGVPGIALLSALQESHPEGKDQG